MFLYRYYAQNKVQYEDGDFSPSKIVLQRFRVLDETDKTWRINDGIQDRRVLKVAEKRFAYPTTELAMKSFKIRRRWYKMRLDRWMESFGEIQELLDKGIYDDA